MRSVRASSRNRTAGPDRFLAVHRRPARGARAGHHHRRRLPLFRDRAAEVHPRRHAGPRAVHAQHGDRGVDRGPRHPAGRRAATACASRRAATRASRGSSASRPSSSPSTRSISSASTRASSAPSATTCRTCSATRAVQAIPLSALHGDNVITSSDRTPWYSGPALLPYLEIGRRGAVACGRRRFRFPVQLVVRPDAEFRGYAGQIASGTVRVGDRITAWPSGAATRVTRIVTWDGDLRRRGGADVGHARARRRSRHQPRRHARDRAAARRAPVRRRRGVDGRAAAGRRAARTS